MTFADLVGFETARALERYAVLEYILCTVHYLLAQGY